MALPAGTRLGPYEIRGLLGVGGMGEVYLAWDARLGREVAAKVLPAPVANDPDRLRRFEQEAKAAGSLSHPNLLSVLDVGSHDGSPYIVTERLEGETLRQRLVTGEITPRKAVDHAVQIARGLAAAHARGIVHRDLKPENVFVCRDGGVKILDFGVAKLRAEGPSASEDETASQLTAPGSIVGTVAYMSPEQARGLPVDTRADIFSLGVVLYEMLARRRPFAGETLAEVQTAILREDPRPLSATDGRVPVALDAVVRRCLEKRPEDRFDTARDVALILEATIATGASPPASESAGRRARLWPMAVAGALLATALGALLAWTLRPPASAPHYTQLTFRRGMVVNARFTPDADTVLYSAAWDGKPPRLYSSRLGSHESQDLGLEGRLAAVSSKGDAAVLLGAGGVAGSAGTLARTSLSGGAPRELMGSVRDADWDPEGRELAVVHLVDGRTRVEYPIGHVLYEPDGELFSLRFLPDGRIAVWEELPGSGARPYAISLVDRQGERLILSSGWSEPGARPGWLESSAEVVFAGAREGDYALYAVNTRGRERLVASVPGNFWFEDIDRRGRILMNRGVPRGAVLVLPPGGAQEHDLSWLDFSGAVDLSDDGRLLLLSDFGGNLLTSGGIFLRRTDGSPAVMLGEGLALALSKDRRFVLALPDRSGCGDRLLSIPSGAGQRRELRHPSIRRYCEATWFPDGKRVVVVGGTDSTRSRLFVWNIDSGASPQALGPEGQYGQPVLAPDGLWVAAARRGEPLSLYSIEEHSPRPLPGTSAEDKPLRFTADGRSLFVRRGTGIPARIERVEIATGRRQSWKELQPADAAGAFGVGSVVVTPDGSSYAYTVASQIGSLYLVEGLR